MRAAGPNTGKRKLVSIGKSVQTKMMCGVPHRSIQVSPLFNVYMLILGQIMEKNKIFYHKYADDTQIYITLSPVGCTMR